MSLHLHLYRRCNQLIMLLAPPMCASLALALALAPTAARACNRKHAADFVQIHFGKEAEQECLGRGGRCRFDRNCCEGLECRMGAGVGGVVTACAPRWLYEQDYDEQSPRGQQWQDYQEVDASQREPGPAELERRNGELRRRVAELARLRTEERNRQRAAALAELRRRRLEALRAMKGAAAAEERADVEALRRRDGERRLIEEERRQVNRTVSGRSRDLGHYMDMLSDVIGTGAAKRRLL